MFQCRYRHCSLSKTMPQILLFFKLYFSYRFISCARVSLYWYLIYAIKGFLNSTLVLFIKDFSIIHLKKYYYLSKQWLFDVMFSVRKFLTIFFYLYVKRFTDEGLYGIRTVLLKYFLVFLTFYMTVLNSIKSQWSFILNDLIYKRKW